VTMALPVVIVGGGTAGSTVALQLATRTSRDIVLCEPGDMSRWDDESRFFTVLRDDSLVHHESVVVLGRDVEYTQARAMGGGSAVNGMLLTGDEPQYVEGLTCVPEVEDVGDFSRALLDSGGRISRLWWNHGRWNPGRALIHLVEEGRVSWRRSAVSRVVIVDGSVTGVEVDGEMFPTDCVVLTAGAIASPRLLLNSGIVGAGVGEAVQDHPSISFVAERSTANMGRFDACVVRNLQGDDGALGLMVAYERLNGATDSMALVSVMLMNPESRGTISKTNNDITVDLGLLTSERDVSAMRQLVRTAVEILGGVPFQHVARHVVGGAHGTPLADISGFSDKELNAWIRGEVAPVSHVSSSLSTCVDDRGRFHGLRGLVVADASILPRVPYETPAAAVTMEARRIGQLLGEELA